MVYLAPDYPNKVYRTSFMACFGCFQKGTSTGNYPVVEHHFTGNQGLVQRDRISETVLIVVIFPLKFVQIAQRQLVQELNVIVLIEIKGA